MSHTGLHTGPDFRSLPSLSQRIKVAEPKPLWATRGLTTLDRTFILYEENASRKIDWRRQVDRLVAHFVHSMDAAHRMLTIFKGGGGHPYRPRTPVSCLGRATDSLIVRGGRSWKRVEKRTGSNFAFLELLTVRSISLATCSDLPSPTKHDIFCYFFSMTCGSQLNQVENRCFHVYKINYSREIADPSRTSCQ
jgi:hypothetical protein